MIYVYCERPSTSVVELTQALGGRRLKQFDGMDFWNKGKKVVFKEGDIVICWGKSVPELEGVRILNARGSNLDLYKQGRIFADYGIRGLRICRSNPGDLRFIPRKLNHKGGDDLMNPPKNPDYWVEKMNFVNEYRVHSFDKRSIKAGVKRRREDAAGHSWIKTWDCGWKVDYENFESTKELRALAHKVIGVLGLTFGAVDIGELQGGERVVIGVETGPVLTDITLGAYVKAINKWIVKDASGAEQEDPAKLVFKAPEPVWRDPFEEMDKMGPPRPRQPRPQDGQRTGSGNPRPTVSTGRSPAQETADMFRELKKDWKIPKTMPTYKFVSNYVDEASKPPEAMFSWDLETLNDGTQVMKKRSVGNEVR